MGRPALIHSIGLDIIGVPPPAAPVFRVSRSSYFPFEMPDWKYTGANRYDDPDETFRVIYCASQRAGAFGETLAIFRPSTKLLALMREVESDTEPLETSLGDLLDPKDPRRGVIPYHWRFERQIAQARLGQSARFADITAAETVAHLRAATADFIAELGLDDFDLSNVLGKNRDLTKHCARYIYEQEVDGCPRFAGIRYPSRHNHEWTCWAVFEDRVEYEDVSAVTPIDPDDPDFLEAARLLGLSIIRMPGSPYVHP